MPTKFRNANLCKPVDWGQVLYKGGADVGTVYPGDVDGFMERNGHFLFLEWKDTTVEVLPQGQVIAYRRLSQQPNTRVLVLFGDQDSHTLHSLLEIINGKEGPRLGWNNQHLVNYIRHWWRTADQSPAVH